MSRIPGLNNTNQSQLKQEYLCEEVNNNFYETTFRHKFKKGDRVKLKKDYVGWAISDFIVKDIEAWIDEDGHITVYYRDKNGLFQSEVKLELVERINNE